MRWGGGGGTGALPAYPPLCVQGPVGLPHARTHDPVTCDLLARCGVGTGGRKEEGRTPWFAGCLHRSNVVAEHARVLRAAGGSAVVQTQP